MEPFPFDEGNFDRGISDLHKNLLKTLRAVIIRLFPSSGKRKDPGTGGTAFVLVKKESKDNK